MLNIFKGFILGIVLSIPVGPIGILGLQKCIVKGEKIGFISGVGIASADFVFALLAVFGLISIVDWVPEKWVLPLTVIALVTILIFSIKIFFTKIEINENDDEDEEKVEKYFWKMFAITLTNPVTLITFVSLMKLFNVQNILWHQIIFAIGVYIGSVSWWYVISHIIEKLMDNFSVKIFEVINKMLSVFLVIFVIYEFLELINII